MISPKDLYSIMVITLSYDLYRQAEDPRSDLRLRSRKFLGSGEEAIQTETTLSWRLGRIDGPNHSQDRRKRSQDHKILRPRL